MKYSRFLILILLCSCFIKLPTEPESNLVIRKIRADANFFDCDMLSNLNGIYEVVLGESIFGNEVAVVCHNNSINIYSSQDVVYASNTIYHINDSIICEGYYRIVRSGFGENITLVSTSKLGAKSFIDSGKAENITFKGKSSKGKAIEIRKVKQFQKSYEQFSIIGHRGGGRNSDRLGFAENSIEIIQHSQALGATAVEIDIKRTRDGEIILFHDDTFSPRTVQGAYLLGSVDNFDLKQIKLFGRLVNGETIPTLEEALNYIIDSTSLSLVWIDVKDKLTVNQIIQIQLNAVSYAKLKNRNVQILFGIPNVEILNAYSNQNISKTNDILIELSLETAMKYDNCKVWAPRWTNNVNNSDISNFKSQGSGKIVFVWTVDVKEYITKYVNEKNVDGILSNYPSLVAGIY